MIFVLLTAFVVAAWPVNGWSPALALAERGRDKLIEYATWRPHVAVYEKGELYLTRYYLLGRKSNSGIPDEAVRLRWLPTVWVHHFERADAGRAQHNHPWWWAVSLVLAGAYIEERGRKRRLVRYVNFITRNTFHRVAMLEGDVWTLFTTGRYAGPWGFIVGGKVVPWDAYVRARDEPSSTTDRR